MSRAKNEVHVAAPHRKVCDAEAFGSPAMAQETPAAFDALEEDRESAQSRRLLKAVHVCDS